MHSTARLRRLMTGISLLACSRAHASGTDATAYPLGNTRIAIDGVGSDEVWTHADPLSGFTQRLPVEGAPSDPTIVRVASDDDALYVLVEAIDSRPDEIIGRRTRRDETNTSDWVHLWIATNGRDDRYGYRFSVNAGGVKQDARLLDGATEDLTFNAVWDAEAKVHARGWTVEYRIPFHQLGYASLAEFRFQIVRDQAHTGEQSTLFPFPRAATWPVRYMRPLGGLSVKDAPLRGELVPFVTLDWSGPPYSAQPSIHAGADLKLSLSPEVTLQGTILPDFGQVEADPSELNLSVYETFLTERRPFFLDGAESLDFGLRQGTTTDKLYYSRRIGQPPRVDPGVPSNGILDYPKQTTILAASKLTARGRSGYTIGILQATTQEAYARISNDDAPRRVLVSPLTQYFLARGTKVLGDGRTSVGVAATTVNRELGQTLSDELAKNATTAGLDFEHRTHSVRIVAKAFGSKIQGEPEAIAKIQQNSVHYFQRPDARHVSFDPSRTSLAGYGGTLVASKFTGEPWRASWGGTFISPGFDPNDLGFLQKADDINAFANVQYLVSRPGRFLRSYNFESNLGANFTFAGEPTSRAAALSGTFVMHNLATAKLQVQRDTDRVDPRALRGGPAMTVPGKFSSTLSIATDDRRSIALDLSTWGGRNDGNVSYWVGGQASLRLRPTTYVQLAFGPYYQHNLDGFSYVNRTDEGSIIVARMPRDTVSVAIRGNVTLTPNLTLQLYAMPYFSAAQRSTFAEVVAPQSSSFESHFRPFAPDADRFIWFSQMRLNAVARWEYTPGSAAFVVWSRDQSSLRSDRGSLEFERDVHTLLTAPSTNVVMVKWAHWLAF